MLTKEQIRRNYESGLEMARRYFMGDADVQRAAKRLAAALDEMGVPYVICGALAVMAHGHARLTQDVDVLLTADGLRRFKERWLGRGWVERFPGSKGMRDVEHNVKVDVLLAGDYPGDGKRKPVRFPEPESAAVDLGDVKTLTLPKLIELKLASGMTAPDRPRDLDDVIQLVRVNVPAATSASCRDHAPSDFAQEDTPAPASSCAVARRARRADSGARRGLRYAHPGSDSEREQGSHVHAPPSLSIVVVACGRWGSRVVRRA